MKLLEQIKAFIVAVNLLLIITTALSAELRVSRLFSDHMVLQRNAEIPVWGWGNPGAAVRVKFLDQAYRTEADSESGAWRVTLPPVEAGGPHEMEIKSGGSTVTVRDILVGEVWLCSGQSNMEWPVSRANNAEEEIANADHPKIRHFNVPRRMSTTPEERLEEGVWEVSSPETAGDFTAVGYFFARELKETLGVPIGLINSSWGGTIVETWISAGAIQTIDAYEPVVERLRSYDLESIVAQRLAEVEEKIGETLPREDLGMKNGEPVWAKPGTDRKDWKSMQLPSPWEEAGLPDLDGVVWFSKTINLPSDSLGGRAKISLGTIDDEDITWINGQKVGGMTEHIDERVYSIPQGVLKQGENEIVVRVKDTGGGGGLDGKSEQMYLTSGDTELPLDGTWKYKIGMGKVWRESIRPNHYPTLLYNGMIHPLIPFSFRGAIWYQGESNADTAEQYRTTFPMLINNWREGWDSGDFPFLWVQLANYRRAVDEPGDSTWAELREVQTQTLRLPKTGQAVIIDIGEANDIHPGNKQDVGRRLALNARKIAYGEDLIHASPCLRSMDIQGDQILLMFDNVGDGLVVKDKYGYVNGFTVAGADREFHWAQARIVGDREILIHCDSVSDPEAVRYGWANNPDDLNLYNSAGLPATPFRSDDWEGVTTGKVREFR